MIIRDMADAKPYPPGIYEDDDGDYWLKTKEGLWLYSDMMWGDEFALAAVITNVKDPEVLELRRISPEEIDCTFTEKYHEDLDDWLDRIGDAEAEVDDMGIAGMRVIEPSVSEREAEKMYPTQYWEGTKTKRSFDTTTDDLQDAYMRGREAEPCAEQVEAALAAFDRHKFYRTDNGVDAVCCCGAVIEKAWPHDRPMIRHQVSMMLEAARKAVM